MSVSEVVPWPHTTGTDPGNGELAIRKREQPGPLKPLDETGEGKEATVITASTLFIQSL